MKRPFTYMIFQMPFCKYPENKIFRNRSAPGVRVGSHHLLSFHLYGFSEAVLQVS